MNDYYIGKTINESQNVNHKYYLLKNIKYNIIKVVYFIFDKSKYYDLIFDPAEE